MTLVLGIEILRVTVFVSGLVIFFANATTLALDASINSSAAHFVSASTLVCISVGSIGSFVCGL